MRRFFVKAFIWLIVLVLVTGGIIAVCLYSNIAGCKSSCRASVDAWSEHYGLDRNLVYAIIYAESGGKVDAVSDAGAVGVMQLMPATAQWIANKEEISYNSDYLWLKDTNIRLGCAYLAYLCGIYKHTDNVLAAYNAGPANVDQWLKDGRYSDNGVIKNPPYGETASYIKKVNTLKAVYGYIK